MFIMTKKIVREERRSQILEALHRCLLKKPIHQTSIKDIAGQAGMNPGMLHYYFNSKEDILLHYIDYVMDVYSKSSTEMITSVDITGPVASP